MNANYQIIKNIKLNDQTFLIELKGPTKWLKPGRFCNILIPNKFLRRPMSVYDWNKDSFKIIYKVVGEGTKTLSKMQPQTKIDVLVDLGNSYQLKPYKKQLIVCGGTGIGSVFSLAKALTKKQIDVTIIIGFKTKSDVFQLDEWKKVCKKLIICTDDGSYGFCGNVVDAMRKYHLLDVYYYACGSINLMQAVYRASHHQGQLSLEARFGCGFGACMGCSIQTKNDPQRICKDGPIFHSKDLIW